MTGGNLRAGVDRRNGRGGARQEKAAASPVAGVTLDTAAPEAAADGHADPGGTPETDATAVAIQPSSARRPPEPTAGLGAADLIDALGEQTALIVGAMDRWFEHVLASVAEGGLARPASRPVTGPEAGRPDAAKPAALPPQPPTELPSATSIARFPLAERWEGWRHHQAAALRPYGILELGQSTSTPGILSYPISVPPGALLRIIVRIKSETKRGEPVLHLRVIDANENRLGADRPIQATETECLCYVPRRLQEVQLYLIAYGPRAGFRFNLVEVDIATVDRDEFYDRRVRGVLPAALASLASIPARREMLADCVATLLLQCDRVRVFLNGYPDVPDFLNHPRIEVRRSQDWDDRGDAGKFAWVGAQDGGEYRVIADDDLIYPADFVRRMIEVLKLHNNRAIAGLHGILLKQPITEYYSEASRWAFYFAGNLRDERTVHVLGTNAVCYHASVLDMHWQDFMFPNMADIFLARYAQRHALPMIAIPRAPHWVVENVAPQPIETIYANSAGRTGSRFDTSWIQDSVVKSMPPLTLQPTMRAKLVLLLLVESAAAFQATVRSWHAARSIQYDWALIAVAAAAEEAAAGDVASALGGWSLDHELHLIIEPADSVVARVNAGLTLAASLGAAMVVLAAGEIRFARRGWEAAALALLGQPGCGAVVARAAETVQDRNGAAAALAFLTPAALTNAGLLASTPSPAATADFNAWLARLSEAGEARSGAADGGPDKDAAPRGHRDSLAAALAFGAGPAADDAGAGEAPMAPAYLRCLAPPAARLAATPMPPSGLTINDTFARVLLINLDRRPDRLAGATERLTTAGIRAERVAAVDGSAPEVAAEYAGYTAALLRSAPEVRPVRSSADFFLDYDSQTARVAYVETTRQRKAIESAGAWGYLRTWQRILTDALRARTDSVLVFDDDVVLHRQTATLFAGVLGGLPANWLVLQLGSLQYDWQAPWLTWHNRFLYCTGGVAIGSHAVAVRLEAMPFLLEQVNRMDLPFDTGALAAICHAFPRRCFVAYPNIAIQRIAADSDIMTSGFQRRRSLAEVAQTYRWTLDDYDFGAQGLPLGEPELPVPETVPPAVAPRTRRVKSRQR